MKKIALLLLVAAVAVSSAAAATKKKETKTDPNDAGWRLVRDGFPLVLPSWALPVYFTTIHKEPNKKQ